MPFSLRHTVNSILVIAAFSAISFAASVGIKGQTAPSASDMRHRPVTHRHTTVLSSDSTDVFNPDEAQWQTFDTADEDSLWQARTDSILAPLRTDPYDQWEPTVTTFNPDPNRAVWMSALFPGLGQIYNRRFWKLPIIVGGYMGLAYATSWNNTMLTDYTNAYRDIMDNDPDTKSYMDFFSPTVQESDLDKTWLTNVLQSRKNYFRRNRDLCIICMVGVYLLAMVDAYVDASLSHFDISPDLSFDVAPTLLQDGRGVKPSIGLTWALNF